jgi:hypothetical protein
MYDEVGYDSAGPPDESSITDFREQRHYHLNDDGVSFDDGATIEHCSCGAFRSRGQVWQEPTHLHSPVNSGDVPEVCACGAERIPGGLWESPHSPHVHQPHDTLSGEEQLICACGATKKPGWPWIDHAQLRKPDPEVQIVLPSELQVRFRQWLADQNLRMFLMPEMGEELRTYGIGPRLSIPAPVPSWLTNEIPPLPAPEGVDFARQNMYTRRTSDGDVVVTNAFYADPSVFLPKDREPSLIQAVLTALHLRSKGPQDHDA